MSGRFKKDFLFKFIGDTADLERSVSRAERSLGGMDQKVSGSDKAMVGLKKAAGAVGGMLAAGAFANGIKASIGRAEEMNSLYAITETIIEETGGAANVTGTQVNAMAKEMSQVTGIDKAVAQEAANVLLTFTNLKDEVGEGNQIFQRAHDVTADMATVFGGSAVDAAKQLGKALNDPIGGVSALSRVGVQFTDQQKEQIRTLVESGDVLGAQKIILGELEMQVGGTAEASADATAQIGNAFDEVTEAIGQELLPAIESIAPAVVSMANAVAEGIGNFGLGASQINEFVQRGRELLSLGTEDYWTADQEAMQKWEQTAGHANKRLEDGYAAAQVAAEWMVHLAKEHALTAETVDRTVEALDLSNEEMVRAREIAAEYGEQLGATEDDLAGLEEVTSDYARQAARDAVAAEEDLAEAAREHAFQVKSAAEETDGLTEATESLNTAMKELTDPVFRAEEATRKYEEALEDAYADGVLTKEETMNVTQAYIDMKVAGDELTAEGIEAYGDAAREALGLTEQQAADAKADIDALAHIDMSPGMRALNDVATRLESITGKKIHVDVSDFRLASQAEIDRAITDALRRAQRRGLNIPI